MSKKRVNYVIKYNGNIVYNSQGCHVCGNEWIYYMIYFCTFAWWHNKYLCPKCFNDIKESKIRNESSKYFCVCGELGEVYFNKTCKDGNVLSFCKRCLSQIDNMSGEELPEQIKVCMKGWE